MATDALHRIFKSNPAVCDRIAGLLAKIESEPSTFYAVIRRNNKQFSFEAVSKTVESVTGYSIKNFSGEGGFDFFYSLTLPEVIPDIMRQEADILKVVRHPKFDINKNFIGQIVGAIRHAKGHVVDLRMSIVILEVTDDNHLQFLVNVWQLFGETRVKQHNTSKDRVNKMLTAIKKLYLADHSSREEIRKTAPSYSIDLAYPFADFAVITKTEYRVLKMIADGHSSREIAAGMNISENTVESHRKNLLRKLVAKNSAELIKKATKRFWLE